MKSSESLVPSHSKSFKLYRLRLFRFFYILLCLVCIGWLFVDRSWEPVALTVLSLLGLGSLGPEFAKLPRGAVSNVELGAKANNLAEPTISQSWIAMISDTVGGATFLAFQALIHFLGEGIVYLILVCGFYLVKGIACLF